MVLTGRLVLLLSCCVRTTMPASDEEAVHLMVLGYETRDQPSQSVKEQMERLRRKLCSPPQPFRDIPSLKRYDACGASLLYGRTNVRNCFTAFIGFRDRVSLEHMYQMRCLMTREKQEQLTSFLTQCLAAIAAVTPKQEFKDLVRKVASSKEKEQLTDEYTEYRLQCEMAALGL